jgi:L-2-hydroxyglutarate oxidase LhgO
MADVDARVECIVVGAGVIGLAVARALARVGREVLVLEAARTFGTETSSRNSEVVHSGIYYPKGSLKARLCVSGKTELYSYCDSHGVPFRRCGKIIVATRDDELPALERISRAAQGNGVTDLVSLSASEVSRLEPAVFSVGGLLSPSTGIVDSHALMSSLHADAVQLGATIAYQTPVVAGETTAGGVALRLGGREPATVEAEIVVNAAGLHAQRVARSIRGVSEASVPACHYARGNYFSIRGKPFSRLVYPIPEPGGLGVHATIDLAGEVRFGPDVEWIDEIDYRVEPERAARFYPVVRRYYPALADDALEPAYAGVRPKLSGPNDAAHDFLLQGPEKHGVSGLINLYGIESPGLTASFSIADEVLCMLSAPSSSGNRLRG